MAGAKGAVFTCKHHDGFCLWPTETTPYNISATPDKDGKGDVVKEVSDSCRKYGIKFGVYLSPWDRNHQDYSTPKYNDIYCQQLTELLTNYGEVYCVWFDGACGAYMDGKEKQVYDWERYFALIRRLTPMVCVSNCGPDIRWVGNEGGFARESEWNVVPQFAYDIQTIEANSQLADDSTFEKKGADVVFSDLGSRKFLSKYENLYVISRRGQRVRKTRMGSTTSHRMPQLIANSLVINVLNMYTDWFVCKKFGKNTEESTVYYCIRRSAFYNVLSDCAFSRRYGTYQKTYSFTPDVWSYRYYARQFYTVANSCKVYFQQY